MKKALMVLLAILVLIGAAVAQSDNTASPDSSLIKEFTRSSKTEGLVLSFVLLNAKTVDALFKAPGKYAMRATANQSTTFYVQGTPEKDITLDTNFKVEQNGQKINCKVANIKNFASGNVAKGQMINGLLQLESKLEIGQPFTIAGPSGTVEFKLTDQALEMAK
jgi:hypothetical protein